MPILNPPLDGRIARFRPPGIAAVAGIVVFLCLGVEALRGQPSPLPTPLMVTGQVLDGADRPIVGAGVELLPGGSGGPAVASARTVENGTFRLLAPAPGVYRLHAFVGSGVGRERPVAVVGAVGLPALRLDGQATTAVAVPPTSSSRRLFLRLIGADGAPLPRAFLWVDGPPLVVATPDLEGVVELTLPSALGHIYVAAPGHGSRVLTSAEFPVGSPGEHPASTLALAPAVELRGRVVNGGGTPVAGVEVQVHALPDATPAARAWTDPKGRFWLSGVPAGRNLVLAAKGSPGNVMEQSLAALPPGIARPLELTIELQRGIAGWLRWSDGRPASDLEVQVFPTGGAETSDPLASTPLGRARSDARGYFELPLAGDLALPELDIEVLEAGTVLFVLPRVSAPPVRGRVDVGVVELPSAVILEGSVTDPQGRPVSGARLGARSTDDVEIAHGLSGSDGRFELGRLPAVGDLILAVDHPRFVPLRVALLAPNTAPLSLTLWPGAHAAGRVVDSDGRPIAEAEVIARARPGDGVSAEVTVSVASNSEGRFDFELPLGMVQIGARAVGYQPTLLAEIDLAAGVDEEFEIRLRPAGRVEGRVLDAEGRSVAEARVRLLTPDSANEHGLSTGPGGEFIASDLPLGRCWLFAEYEGQVAGPRAVDLVAGATKRVDLKLAPIGEVAGVVVDITGRPLDGVVVGWSRDGRREQVESGADGAFTLTGSLVEALVLTARKAGFQPREQVLTAGSKEPLRLVLTPGTVIHGQLVGTADLTGAEVAAMGLSGTQEGTLTTNGRYRLDGLAAGDWTLVGNLPNGRRTSRAFRVDPGAADLELDLDLGDSGFLLAVRVESAGQPLPGARVGLRAVDRLEIREETTGPTGEARFGGLLAGEYRLEVTDRGSGFAHAEPLKVTGDRLVVVAAEPNG